MKIKKEDYEELKRLMELSIKAKPKLRQMYRNHGLSDTRYAWNLFTRLHRDLNFAEGRAASSIQARLYEYLYDSHIQTALLKIIKGRK